MAEYIEKNTALAKLTALEVIDSLATMIDAKRVVVDIPAADVAPVVHGQWVKDKDSFKADSFYIFRCSICNDTVAILPGMASYCPWCGAKMDKKWIREDEER